jgi:hypothetical protein
MGIAESEEKGKGIESASHDIMVENSPIFI